jgi:DNA-binding transcriptional regulator YbjK
MANPYHRQKQPEAVRRALLEQAARLAVEQGVAAVTVQAIADAAGVTKGGLTHHFPSKQALKPCFKICWMTSKIAFTKVCAPIQLRMDPLHVRM